MAIPTVSWNETTPADTALRSEGDDRIRELKTQLREIIAVDHVMASSGSDTDWGFHNKVTLKVQGSAPTAVADCMLLYAKDVAAKAELFMRNEDGTEMQLTSAGNFVGGIASEVRMWSGTLATIPTGWALCDGASGRPDLLAKFIRGVATAATDPGTTGGSDSVTEVANHTHTITVDSGGAHTHTGTTAAHSSSISASTFPTTGSGGSITTSGSHTHTFTTASGGSHTHTGSSANPAGGVSSYDNRPAYYELAFIIRT